MRTLQCLQEGEKSTRQIAQATGSVAPHSDVAALRANGISIPTPRRAGNVRYYHLAAGEHCDDYLMGEAVSFPVSKHRARRTPCGFGHIHPSGAEAKMCLRLHTLELGKQITGLVYPGKRVTLPCGHYTPDFSYYDVAEDCEKSLEVKGFQDKAWRLRWREVELYTDMRLEVWQLRGAGWRRILPPKAWAKQRTEMERSSHESCRQS
jgi:hypothetical protein